MVGYEGFTSWGGNRKSPERKTVIIGTTNKVIREFEENRHLEDLSLDAKRVLERILRENNRGRKTVVSGETKAIAAWIYEVKLACNDVN